MLIRIFMSHKQGVTGQIKTSLRTPEKTYLVLRDMIRKHLF